MWTDVLSQRPFTPRQLLRDGAWTVGIRIAGNLLAFAYTVWLARWLGAAEYGLYNAVTMLATLGAMVAGCGLPTLVIRKLTGPDALPDAAAVAHGMTWASTAVTFVLAALLAVPAFLAGLAVSADGSRMLLLAAGLGAPLLVCIHLLNMNQSVLLALGRHLAASVAGFLLRPLLLALALGGAYLAAGALERADQVLTLLLASVVLASGIASWFARHWLPGGARCHLGEVLRWYREGVPFLLSRLGRALWGRIEVAWLLAFASHEATGHYALGLVVAGALANVADVQARLLTPIAARRDGQVERIAPRIARYCTMVVVPVVAFLWAFGEGFLGLFGRSYADAVRVVQLLASAQLVLLIAGSAVTVLVMRNQQRMVARTALLCAMGIAVGSALLGPSLGALGCAMTHLAVSAAWALVMWWRLMRVEGVRTDVFAGLRGRRDDAGGVRTL